MLTKKKNSILLRDVDQNIIDLAKRLTKQKTASKAFLSCPHDLHALVEDYNKLLSDKQSLQFKYDQLLSSLNNSKNSIFELAEILKQGDLKL